MEGLASLLPLIAIFAIFWLLVIRPAQNRNKAQARLQQGLSAGDQVMLSSGFYGTLRSAEDPVEVELADGVVVRVARAAVQQVIHDEEPVEEAPAGDEAAGPEETTGPEER